MGPLPVILGGGLIALIAAAASKPKAVPPAATQATKPPSTISTISTPIGTTTITSTQSPAMVSASTNVPYVIAMRVIELSDPTLQRSQAVWLNDNGYPKTAQAVFAYSSGELSANELRKVAQAEFAAVAAAPASARKRGVTTMDPYGQSLLRIGSEDELYSYAVSSTSLPFVSAAAARLAAAGDTRAAALTQHLADLSL